VIQKKTLPEAEAKDNSGSPPFITNSNYNTACLLAA
jgi:hypothetical protein